MVSAAAAAILAMRAGSLEVRTKADHSPVTAADHAAEAVILEGLAHLLPGVASCRRRPACFAPPASPTASSWSIPSTGRGSSSRAGMNSPSTLRSWPADGPSLGVVAAPAQGLLWRGIVGHGAERLRLAPGRPPAPPRKEAPSAPGPPPRTAWLRRQPLASRPATQAFLSRLSIEECVTCGSAVKFCQVAEGVADVYPRLSTTCEWDVAAGHALLVAAGGTVMTPEGGA